MPTAISLAPGTPGSPSQAQQSSATAGHLGQATAAPLARRSRPGHLLGREMKRARRLARRCITAVQERFWDERPMTLSKAKSVLRAWDPAVEVVRRLPSESHQVFQVTFRGQPCVAKFAGEAFNWKFVLQDEVARIRKLSATSVRVPPVIVAELGRLRNPFFVMPYLAAQPRASWSDTVRRASWAEEAAIVHALPAVIGSAGLPVRKEAVSVAELEKEIATLQVDVVKVGLPAEPYISILDCFRGIIRSKPWVLGQYQPPELIYDGAQFWSIDWDVFSYTHPLKWVNDYSFYDYVRDPEIGEQHLNYLLGALGFDPEDETTQEELRLWQQYKAIAVGTYLIQKAERWNYFATLKERFFD